MAVMDLVGGRTVAGRDCEESVETSERRNGQWVGERGRAHQAFRPGRRCGWGVHTEALARIERSESDGTRSGPGMMRYFIISP